MAYRWAHIRLRRTQVRGAEIRSSKKDNISRGGAVVARWAHNPKVAGSSPVPATKEIKASQKCEAFLFEVGYNIGTTLYYF